MSATVPPVAAYEPPPVPQSAAAPLAGPGDGLNELQNLVDQLPALIASWDSGLICRFANRAYSVWFGVDHRHLPGTTMQALVGPALFAANEPMIRGALRGERQDFERLMEGADGVARNSLVSYLPTTVDGVTTGFIVHINEVNRLKQAEQALRREIAEHNRDIARLRDASGKLRASEEAFRRTLALHEQIPWRAPAGGGFAAVDPSWAEQWNEWTGNLEQDLIGTPMVSLLHEDDQERARITRERAVAEKSVFDHRFRVRSRAGGYRWMRFRTAPLLDDAGQVTEWLGTIEDVDAIVCAEVRQQERDAAYRVYIELSNQIPWTATANGSRFTISEAWEGRWLALTGHEPDVTLDSFTAALMHHADVDRITADTIDCIAAGRAIDQRYRLRAGDGGYRWWRSRGSPLRDAQSNVRRWYGTLEDIDDQVMNEERLEHLEIEARHFQRLGAMNALASTLAHELNQPLAAVSNYLSGARRLLATNDAGKLPLVERALAAAEAATLESGNIIRRLREMVAKGAVLRNAENIALLIDDACILAMADAPARGIEYRIEADRDLPAVMIDRVQFKQVLINLLRNAMEAVDGAPVRRIRIAARVEGAVVEISVSDTGKGVDPTVLDKLFEAFNSTKMTGLGIGLSISRTIVEANGGKISYAPSSSGGACFTVTIPLASE